jgi:hypothetical protein
MGVVGMEKLPVAGFAQKKADFVWGINSDHLCNNIAKTRSLFLRGV